jgi:hypothetical protein
MVTFVPELVPWIGFGVEPISDAVRGWLMKSLFHVTD